jgi:citrate lyase subunit beta/citryl-CoA lyase
MSTVVRPRRSVLFMPGSNARAMEKAKTLAGQGVVLADGQLIENLHVENAQRIVRIADAISAMASA